AIDPTLQKGQAFVGAAALYLYIGVLLIRIIADAMKTVGSKDALQAGAMKSNRVTNELEARMGGRS
ncbi:hypothetical protein, partial [Sphingobium yanoikuyae]